ncbi:MAG: HAD family hydrolase [Blautia sp.]|nr:HAD family hydrolase [Blautia sp.]
MNNARPRKAVFLDRDGVINKCAAPHCYVSRWEDFEFLPGAVEGIKLLNDAGYLIFLISNQRGIARGLYTIEEVQTLHEMMCGYLERMGAHIDGIYICPHNYGECDCRKPGIGLFRQAEQEWMIDKEKSWCIGDFENDIMAGIAYGVKTILIGDETEKYGQDYTFSSLQVAGKYLAGKTADLKGHKEWITARQFGII